MDTSPLAKAIEELEDLRGKRYDAAWAELRHLRAVAAVAGDMAVRLERDCPDCPELDTYNKAVMA